MADKTDEKRLIDVNALLKKTRKGQVLSLQECADIWGVTKPRFVNKRKEMDFPEHVSVKNNAHVFDRREVLKTMKAFLERHEKAAESKAERLSKLTGAPDQMASNIRGDLSIAELAKANQMRAQFEQEAIEQGKLVLAEDVSFVLGAVFSELSEFMSNLSNFIDPHGRLPPELRKMVDKNGSDQLLSTHRRLKRFLTSDAVDKPTGKAARGSSKRKAPRRRKTNSKRKT